MVLRSAQCEFRYACVLLTVDGFRYRAPSCRAPILVCSARMVCEPMAPSGVAPTLRCNAFLEIGPKTPSAVVPTHRWIARVVIGPMTPSTASSPVDRLLETVMAARVVERDTVVVRATPALAAPPLVRVSPARWLQTGQAPGPCAARTRLAVAI